jgi:hypothetical protein
VALVVDPVAGIFVWRVPSQADPWSAAWAMLVAYNLANFLRQLVLPKPILGWTPTALREKLVKFGG